jgi:hypothetical protein
MQFPRDVLSMEEIFRTRFCRILEGELIVKKKSALTSRTGKVTQVIGKEIPI